MTPDQRDEFDAEIEGTSAKRRARIVSTIPGGEVVRVKSKGVAPS